MTVYDILAHLNAWAPVSGCLHGDNVGLLVGDGTAPVTGITVALDVTMEGIREAAARGDTLMVTHHPVIFSPPAAILAGTFEGDRLRELIRRGIAVISMHTNLDIAPGGVNDVLASTLGLIGTETLAGTDGVVRRGQLSRGMSGEEFIKQVKRALSIPSVRHARLSDERIVRTVAVGGGACAEDLPAVIDGGCDAFITAECKLRHYLTACHHNLLLIDAGHFATENVIIPPLVRYLQKTGCPVTAAQCEDPMVSG